LKLYDFNKKIQGCGNQSKVTSLFTNWCNFKRTVKMLELFKKKMFITAPRTIIKRTATGSTNNTTF
jgi:hypothetical protein